MDIGAYIAASGATASQTILDSVAHNLANASTPSFKRVMMQQASVPFEFPGQDADAAEGLGFTKVVGPIRDDRPGELIPTDNPLDLAIQGKGFFEVQGPHGVIRTRSGRFQIDGVGNMVTTEGFPVLSEQGQTVRTDPDQVLEFAPNGEIQAGIPSEGVFSPQGRLRIVDENGTPVKEEDFQVRQRHLEMSNVKPMEEMVEMLTQVRSHDSYLKLIKGFADLEEKATTELGRL